MNYLLKTILFSLLLPSFVSAVENVGSIAEVVKLRGEITQLRPGSKVASKVGLGDKFIEDTSIVTGPKSFIKIKFVDNSELNIGPESKIIITEMKKDSVGIISLLKGRIRTEVQKDTKAPNANKFFIKTRTAALGVRGTDFQTIYNPENKMTSLLTFKGEVAMASMDEKTYHEVENAPEPTASLESEKPKVEVVRNELTKDVTVTPAIARPLDEIEALNKILKSKSTVLVPPGQNSFSTEGLRRASQPVKISPVQLNALFKNTDFNEKTPANLNLQSALEKVAKPLITAAPQVAPPEGYVNETTGEFAPRAGGFLDLKTGLYIPPASDAVLDAKSGVYVSEKIGDMDADTGQYVAPNGLILDSKKGFILTEEDGSKGEKAPELLALKEDLNKNIAKDIQISPIGAVIAETPFNINEKFIRDQLLFSLWFLKQDVAVNKDTTNSMYNEVNSNNALRFALEWHMSTITRFSPMVGIDYSIINFENRFYGNTTIGSKKLFSLSFGTQFALTETYNLFSTIGLNQEHFLNQTSVNFPGNFDLQKIVLTRLTLGGKAEFWRKNRFSVDATAAGLFTFRKRINAVVVNEGAGLILEALPKYKLNEKRWIGLGLKIEHQYQRVSGTAGITRQDRDSHGLELKYIADF